MQGKKLFDKIFGATGIFFYYLFDKFTTRYFLKLLVIRINLSELKIDIFLLIIYYLMYFLDWTNKNISYLPILRQLFCRP